MAYLTAVYEPAEDGLIRDAVQLVLETNREEAEKKFEGRDGVVREPLTLEEVER